MEEHGNVKPQAHKDTEGDAQKQDTAPGTKSNAHFTVDIPKLQLQKDTTTSYHAAVKDNAKSSAPLHPLGAQAEPLSDSRKLRNLLIWSSILLVIVVPAVVGPVYYTQVQQPRDRAAAEAAARAAIKPPVPPLPPLVPVTVRFYDNFSTLSNDSWSHQIGNGLERGWDFVGFGNGELQCFTSANVDTVPDPTNSTNTVLKLQAVYHPTAIPCTDQDPYKQATTQWTSGRIRTKSKRIFQAPQTRLPNTTSTDNCTSLFIEARMRLPAVKGNKAALLLLPEPQNQPMGAPRCEWTDECGAYGVWPASGEIDIMEHKDTGTKVSQAIQYQQAGVHEWRDNERDLAEDTLSWHNFKIEWNCDYLRWYVDDQRVFGVSRLEVQPWPFDQPFYLAISYAIGGRLVDGNVDKIDSQLLVDYVRAWYGNEEPPTTNVLVAANQGVSNQTVDNSTAATGSNNNSNNTVTATRSTASEQSPANSTQSAAAQGNNLMSGSADTGASNLLVDGVATDANAVSNSSNIDNSGVASGGVIGNNDATPSGV